MTAPLVQKAMEEQKRAELIGRRRRHSGRDCVRGAIEARGKAAGLSAVSAADATFTCRVCVRVARYITVRFFIACRRVA